MQQSPAILNPNSTTTPGTQTYVPDLRGKNAVIVVYSIANTLLLYFFFKFVILKNPGSIFVGVLEKRDYKMHFLKDGVRTVALTS